MSPEERDEITTSIANLWSFQAMFMADLLLFLRDEGFSRGGIERFLQSLDRHVDILEGPADQSYATGLLATVRRMLQDGEG